MKLSEIFNPANVPVIGNNGMITVDGIAYQIQAPAPGNTPLWIANRDGDWRLYTDMDSLINSWPLNGVRVVAVPPVPATAPAPPAVPAPAVAVEGAKCLLHMDRPATHIGPSRCDWCAECAASLNAAMEREGDPVRCTPIAVAPVAAGGVNVAEAGRDVEIITALQDSIRVAVEDSIISNRPVSDSTALIIDQLRQRGYRIVKDTTNGTSL